MSIATGWHIDHVATRRLPIAMKEPTERSRHFSILIAVAALVLLFADVAERRCRLRSDRRAARVDVDPGADLQARQTAAGRVRRRPRRRLGRRVGTPTPDKPNGLPGGGVPLPDAVHARIRYRGTCARRSIPSGERRREREPARRPLPSRVGGAAICTPD